MMSTGLARIIHEPYCAARRHRPGVRFAPPALPSVSLESRVLDRAQPVMAAPLETVPANLRGAIWCSGASSSKMGVMMPDPLRVADIEAFSELGQAVPALEAMHGIRLPLNDPAVAVWRVPLQAGDDELARLVELLSADERSRMDAFAGGAHKRRFAVAHGAVRLLLAHHLRQHARDLVFVIGAHGKPHLAAPSALELNLTHSEELALIALSCRGAVGVDVESLARRPFDLQPIARRVLSAPEQEWLAGTAAPARAGAFLQLWACKEAVSKAAGKGFTTGFARIRIDPDRLSPGQAQDVQAAGGRWRLHVLDPGGGYVGALAVAAAPAAAE